MISQELLKRIREIEIRTRRVLTGSQIGGHVTAQKGSGFEFDQIREYQYGDDVRFIDWKSSARSQKILVKQYLEERNRTIMIGVDLSASMFFGSSSSLKVDIAQQIAGAIALIADYGKDQVGLILFSDEIEAVVPPGRGKGHVRRVLTELFSEREVGKQTDLNLFFNHPLIKNKKKELLFLLSDFIVDDFEKSLAPVAQHKECVFIRCADIREKDLYSAGLLWMEDLETGEMGLIDTRKKNSKRVSDFMEKQIESQRKICRKHGVAELLLNSHDDFVRKIVTFFKTRST